MVGVRPSCHDVQYRPKCPPKRAQRVLDVALSRHANRPHDDLPALQLAELLGEHLVGYPDHGQESVEAARPLV